MIGGVAFFVVAILVIAIWVLVEIKRLKHKLFAIFLIVLIIFSYVSFVTVLQGHDIDYMTVSGLTDATKLYFFWLGSIFGNLKTMTTHAIHMDWATNQTEIFE